MVVAYDGKSGNSYEEIRDNIWLAIAPREAVQCARRSTAEVGRPSRGVENY